MSEKKEETNNQSFSSHINIPKLNVDVNYSGLKVYLDNISSSLNQHAYVINSLEQNLQTKVDIRKLSDSLLTISQGIDLHDHDFSRIVQQSLGKNLKLETIGNLLETAECKFFNKELLISHGMTYLFQKIQNVTQWDEFYFKFQRKFDDFEAQLNDKVTKSVWRLKKKKHKKLHQEQINDIRLNVTSRISEFEKRIVDNAVLLENKLLDTEKKTLWRINDCEEILRGKVNEIYVNDSIRNLEEKLRRQFGSLYTDAEKYEERFSDLYEKIQQLDVSLSDKLKGNKKFYQDLENSMNKNYVKTFKYEEQHNALDAKLGDLVLNFKELEKKTDFNTVINRQNLRLRGLEDRIAELENDILKRIQQLTINAGDGTTSHKFCEFENDLARIQSEYNKTKGLLRDLQSEIQNKLDLVDQVILGTADINQATKQDQGVLSTEELKHKINDLLQKRLEQVYSDIFMIIDDEKVKKIFKELSEINKRMESVQDNDKKLQKILKELDINNLIKSISSKAEEQAIQVELLQHDNKLLDLKDIVNKLVRDVDNLLRSREKDMTNSKVKPQTIQEEQVILTSKKLYPLSGNCISCYKIPNNFTVKQSNQNGGFALGSDGKPYKIDMSTMFNQAMFGQEIQVSGLEHQNSQPSIRNSRPQTAKMRIVSKRPDSGK